MNAPRIPRKVVLLIALVVSPQPLWGQSLSGALNQLVSPDYAIRKSGFYQILRLANEGAPPTPGLHPRALRLAKFADQHPEVSLALIRVLERENIPDAAKGSLSEDPYYGDLIGCVAQLKDPRAVNALMGAIQTGDMATQGLAFLGDAAAPQLLLAARSGGTAQLSVLTALVEMVSLPDIPLSKENRIRSRAVFLSALKDKNRFTRMTALDGLANFSDVEAHMAVLRVATGDSFVVKHEGKASYPVRALAVGTLRKQDSLGVHSPMR